MTTYYSEDPFDGRLLKALRLEFGEHANEKLTLIKMIYGNDPTQIIGKNVMIIAKALRMLERMDSVSDEQLRNAPGGGITRKQLLESVITEEVKEEDKLAVVRYMVWIGMASIRQTDVPGARELIGEWTPIRLLEKETNVI